MLKQVGAALLLGSASIATAFAADQAPARQSANVYRSPENVVVEGQTAQAPRSDWIYLGGDSGWQLRQPAYAWRNGEIVRIDSARQDTPRPKLADDIWANPDERYRSGG